MAYEWNTCNPTRLADPMALGELQSPKENMEVQPDGQFKQDTNYTSGISQGITHADLKTAIEASLDSNSFEIDFLKAQDGIEVTPTKSPLLGDTVPEFDIDTHLQALTDDPSSVPALLDGYSDVSSCSDPDDVGTCAEVSEETTEIHEALSTKDLSSLDWPQDGESGSSTKPDICETTVLSCELNKEQEDDLLEDQYSNISSPEPEIEKENLDLAYEGQALKQDLGADSESVSDHALDTQKSGEDPLVNDVKNIIKETNISPVNVHDVDANVDILTADSTPVTIGEVPEKTPVPALSSQDNPTSSSPQTGEGPEKTSLLSLSSQDNPLAPSPKTADGPEKTSVPALDSQDNPTSPLPQTGGHEKTPVPALSSQDNLVSQSSQKGEVPKQTPVPAVDSQDDPTSPSSQTGEVPDQTPLPSVGLQADPTAQSPQKGEVPEQTPVPAVGSQDNSTSQSPKTGEVAEKTPVSALRPDNPTPLSPSPQKETLLSSHDNGFGKGENTCQLTSGLESERSSFDFLETCLKNSEDGFKSSFDTVGNLETAGLSTCVEPNQTQAEPNASAQESPTEREHSELEADSLISGTCHSESQAAFKARNDKTEMSDDVMEQDGLLKRHGSGLNLDEDIPPFKVARLTESHNMKKKLDPVVVLDYKEPDNSLIGIYRCAQCSLNAKTTDHAIEHHHVHSQHSFQFCQTCGSYLTCSQLAERHRCGNHEQEKPRISPKTLQPTKPTKAKKLHKCRICPLMFSKKETFRIHEQRHKIKTSFKCHECRLYFSQSSSLRRHQRRGLCLNLGDFSNREEMPTMKPLIKTPYGTFRECYVKLVDIYKKDPASPSNTCKICNKRFKLRAQYNSHLKTHTSEKPYKCKDCYKAFKYSWNLNRHRREQCDRISKICKEEQSEFSVSDDQDQDVEDDEQETSGPSLGSKYPRYKCPLCPRSFKYSYNLVRHLRVQCLKEYTKIGGKGKTASGYKCPLCNVVFTLVCNLNRHIKNTCLPLYKSNKSYMLTRITKSEETDEKSKPEGKPKPKVSLKKKSPYSGTYYKCKLCPAVFSHISGRTKHSRKHKLSAKTGKPVRYRTANPDDLKVTLQSDQRQEENLSCRFCGKCFTESLSLKKHMSMHRGEKPYICQKCGKRFKKNAYLIAHAQSHKRKVQCSVCNKMFATIADFLQHRESHDNKAMLKCPECRMEFRFPVYLLRHLVTHERKDKLEANKAKKATPQPVQKPGKKIKSPIDGIEEFRCSLCQKTFDDSKALSDHCVVHVPKSSSRCQFCKRCFSSRSALVRHIRLHTGEKPFACKKCGKYFRRIEPLKTHMEHCSGPSASETSDAVKDTVKIEVKRGIHKATKQFKCPHCPHSFVYMSSLTKHLKGHKLKLLAPCSKCARCYKKTILGAHEKECNGKNPNTVTVIPCKKCGKSFSRIDNKRVHEKKCRGTALAKVKKSPQEIAAPLNDKLSHRCPHCHKNFQYRSYLLKHLPSHTHDKPYSCMHCGHKYADQRRYLQHEAFCDGIFRRRSVPLQEVMKTEPVNNTQDGLVSAETDGQYRCKFCNKNFAKARNLRRHILTHTDVKPYRCKTCDSCFSRYDHLKVHLGRCKGKKQRLEVRLPKISPKHVGTGWQNAIKLKKEEVYQCKTCSREFTSEINLARHTSLVHTAHKPFSCKRCGSSFSCKSSLKKHTLLVKCKRATPNTSTKTVNAKVTEQKCRETAKLLQRIQGHYSSKLKFQCSYCPRRFKNQAQVLVHTRLHTGEKPYGCENCGERFIRRDYLQRHLIKCTTKKEDTEEVLCDRCGQMFPEKALQSHKSNCVVKSKEIKKEKKSPSPPPKVRTFSCTNCSEKFLLFSQLQQHFLNKHRGDTLHKSSVMSEDVFLKKDPLGEGYETSSAPTNDMGNDDAKPYSCHYCGMRFLNNSGLGMHIRTHTAAYPLSCRKCSKGFWSKNVLKRHLRKCQGKIETNSLSPAVSSQSVSKEESAVLLFNKGSNTTGTGVLQTQFSCKDGTKKPQRKGGRSSGEDHLSDRSKATTNKYQCSECDQSFTDGLLLISHLENHGREDLLKVQLRCKICGREYESRKGLARHMSVVHGKKAPPINTCPICSKSFRFPSDLETHKSCHDPSRPFSCSQCSLRFWTQKSLNQHVTVSHPKTASFTCHPCNKTYSTKKSYTRHKRDKHGKDFATNSDHDGGNGSSEGQFDQDDFNEESDASIKDENEASDDDSDSAPDFPCHVCGKTFSTSESLEDHQRCHLGEKPHECEECGKCFFQLVNLQQHQRSHKSEFQCQTCGRGFVSLFALRKHKHSHGKSRPHRCSKCQLSFTGPTQLAEHMATHRDENFPCDLCDRTFSCKITRAEHRKTHTEQEEELPPLIPPSSTPPLTVPSSASSSSPKSGEQTGSFKYRCGVCNMRFRDPEQLSEHGCKAAKERPYGCPECDKHFLHGSHLKKHQLTHQLAGPYRYQCNQCHMNFTYRHHFLSHIRRHGSEKDTGEATGDGDVPVKNSEPDNIYQCPICPQSYSQAMDLADHLTVHSFMCKVCNVTFSSKAELTTHEQCHLTATTQYECTECGESFFGSDAFRQHQCAQRQRSYVENRTGSQSSSTTTSQKQSSKSSRSVEEEEEVDVGEDFYNCKVCKKRFSSQADLGEHHKTSVDCRPYKCQVCGKRFAKGRYLSKHQQIHERPFRCDVCPQSFDSESSLLTHQVVHNTDRDFQCSVCQKRYTSAHDLLRHEKKHAEPQEKKTGGAHRCDMCYKSFGHLSLLRKHQETHVGEVVYECTECDKAFAFFHLLEEHQQRSHPELSSTSSSALQNPEIDENPAP